MRVLDVDYLVVGAGASGMAFTDTLVTESGANVLMVERRHRPGGHWNDGYPFVRLHQPSAYYGVNSRPLGRDSIDQLGPNSGFYERASGAEVCDYYQRVLDEDLLASSQVRFYGMHDYVGRMSAEHQVVNRLTGEVTNVRVRHKLVDATYLETSLPSTHAPSFDVESNARLVTPNELVGLTRPASGYTVIGAGKTSMDTCNWLLDNGVPPEAIRWIRPRDPWTLDRFFWQPLALLPWLMEGVSRQVEAAAEAADPADLFGRLEACGQFIRLDPEVRPATFRGAILSAVERERLGQIENVVRQGRVLRIGTDEIVLKEGSIPTDGGQVHVDCTAAGLNRAPIRPVFEPGRVTLQWLQWGVLPFSAALIGFIEATRDSDTDKNWLCPPSPPLGEAAHWVRALDVTLRSQVTWQSDPEIAGWMERSRLNVARGVSEHVDDPRMQSALGRYLANVQPALANLEQLCKQLEALATT
ncbi:MAG: hypothetical protein E6G01_12380 [Actinobacteria bacterium]|nr:MAG: hypothetical protein E6G01_12380 [Actinomycetota bacterium]